MSIAVEVKERPILFSTPMVKAILEGRKTVTRRIVDIDHELANDVSKWGYSIFTPEGHISARTKQKTETGHRYGEKFIKLKYGKPGYLLWVRETLYQNGELGLEYFADKEPIDESIIPDDYGPYGGDYSFRAIPNIHMPRWACRLRLEIVSIGVERLHDIKEEDAKREGAPMYVPGHGIITQADVNSDPGYLNFVNYRMGFEHLWTSINGAESWNANPWVWRIEFKEIK